jgi:hypothetical protein
MWKLLIFYILNNISSGSEMKIDHGWIYIGAFAENLSKCKVGFSQISEIARFKQTTYAPDYVPFRYYKIPIEDLRNLEKYLHNELATHFPRMQHLLTGALSECFRCSPVQAAEIVEYELTKCLDLVTDPDGYSLAGIVYQPDYKNHILSGAWETQHQEFIKLFLDVDGNPLPFPTHREWQG